AVGLVFQAGILLSRQIEDPQDLVVGEAHRRIVHPPSVESKPIVIWFSIWQYPKSIPVETDAGVIADHASELAEGLFQTRDMDVKVEGISIEVPGVDSKRERTARICRLWPYNRALPFLSDPVDVAVDGLTTSTVSDVAFDRVHGFDRVNSRFDPPHVSIYCDT